MYICFKGVASATPEIDPGEPTMPQTSFEIDGNTAAALEHLKKVYGVPSNAGVLKRALAIALAASKFADPEYNIHIDNKAAHGESQKVILPQRF